MIRLIQPEKDAPAIKHMPRLSRIPLSHLNIRFHQTQNSTTGFSRLHPGFPGWCGKHQQESTVMHMHPPMGNGRHSSGRRIYPYILYRSISGKETADICIGHCMVYWQPRDTILYTQQFPTRILPAVCFIHTKDLPKPPVFRQPVLSLTGGMI